MLNYKNLTLIGTSHISNISVNQVKNYITNNKPNIIALELDPGRAQSLISRAKKPSFTEYVKHLGFKATLLNLIGAWMEKRLSKVTGVKPGTEMKTALILAKKNDIPIAFIDQDIKITMKKLSRRFTNKEKLNMVKDVFVSPFSKNNQVTFSLNEVPEDQAIKHIITNMKKRYPSIYKTIIHERDIIMAKNLYKLMKDNNSKEILAVVGAGHVQEIVKKINEYYDYEKK